jgi:hypothetical protein
MTISILQFHPSPKVDPRLALSLEQRLEIAFDLARYKLKNTIYYLNQFSQPTTRYPSLTRNESLNSNFRSFFRNPFQRRRKSKNGLWVTTKAKFWSAGAFPGLLWKMYANETDPAFKKFWSNNAKAWGEPLRNQIDKKPTDLTINNLFVFRTWFENSSGLEKNEQLKTILQGAKYLAKPYQKGEGNFQVDIGVMGFRRKADRTDRKTHWQAFIDHTINVEQLLWAADHNPNLTEANDWRNKAVKHIKTIGKYFDENRHPGDSGTWQRGYFDDELNSPTYGQFLFNEGKQGWGDDTTWSRGQAWAIYGASITYQYSKDPEVLIIAKNTINYFLTHLPDRFPGNRRRSGDFIPPWDFDYALKKNPDTQRDSSAAAIAVSGMMKLINVLPDSDPDKQGYLQEVKNILFQLTSTEYLPDKNEPEMSILRHGCYHHFNAIVPSNDYDNGLIWGDYFFIDALLEYQNFSLNAP